MVISPKKCGSRSSQLRSRRAQVLSSGGSGRHGMSGWAAWSEGRQRCTYVYAGRRAPKRCAAGVDAGERPHIEFAASCMQVLRSGSVLVLDGAAESCCLLPAGQRHDARCSRPSSRGPPHTARRAPGCKLPLTTSIRRLRRTPAKRDGVASSGKGRSQMPPSRQTRCAYVESAH